MKSELEIKVTMVDVSSIMPDPDQPRKYFAADKMSQLQFSIKREGILNPLIIYKDKKTGKYLILDGERRYRAAIASGLKKVPTRIIEAVSESDRLIKQFQLQEMYETWTPGEKASALVHLAKEMNTTIDHICKMFSINDRTARRYKAFSTLTNQDMFIKNEIPIEHVENIMMLKHFLKRRVNEILKEKFDRNDEKKVEAAVIRRIKEGSIRERIHYTQVKDAVSKNIKYLEKFLDSDISPEAMFYETKAQGAYHIRNAFNSASYLANHLEKFMETEDVKVSDRYLIAMKRAARILKNFLDKAE